MGVASEQARTNLGLITPYIDSSNLKTINTTNNIQLMLNQHSHLNQQSDQSNQIHKDLAFSAAVNSLLTNHGSNSNQMQYHSYLQKPMEQSNQKTSIVTEKIAD